MIKNSKKGNEYDDVIRILVSKKSGKFCKKSKIIIITKYHVLQKFYNFKNINNYFILVSLRNILKCISLILSVVKI